MKYYLITTSDVRSWKFDQKVLFLGQWCINNENKKYLKNLDYEIMSPIKLSVHNRKKILFKIEKYIHILMPLISKSLNEYHKVRYSEKYWAILIGHWLHRLVSTLFNRFQTLEKAFRDFKISGTTILKYESSFLATKDTLDLIYASNDKIWNHLLYSLIIKHYKIKDLKLNYRNIKGNFYFYKSYKKNNSKIKEEIKIILSKVGNFFLKKNDALIINSYLSPLEYVKLNFYLKQFPQYYLRKKIKFSSPKIRNLLLPTVNYVDPVLDFIQKHLFEFFPTCFFESYKILKQFEKNNFFPSNPKFIFTSNSYDTDEVFKIWVAKKTEENFKYFVGQHGNNAGQHFYLGHSSWPERYTTNRFISWGWDDKRKNTLKGFNFKKSIDLKIKKRKERILLINTCVEHNHFPWDVIDDHRSNFLEQINFVKNLKCNIQELLTTRLYHIENQFDFEEEKIWKKDFCHLSIDRNIFSLKDSILKSRLCIFSYDSTGFLELISNNIPCIAFWPNLEDHLNDDAKFYYKKLKRSKLLHKNGKDAAFFVNEIWDDIETWWNSKSVVEAKSIFSNNYTKKVNNVAFELAKLLNRNL